MEQRIVSVITKLVETIPGSLCLLEFARDFSAMMDVLAEFHPLLPETLVILPPDETGEMKVTLRMTQSHDRPLVISTLNEHVNACVPHLAAQHRLTPLYSLIVAKSDPAHTDQQ